MGKTKKILPSDFAAELYDEVMVTSSMPEGLFTLLKDTENNGGLDCTKYGTDDSLLRWEAFYLIMFLMTYQTPKIFKDISASSKNAILNALHHRIANYYTKADNPDLFDDIDKRYSQYYPAVNKDIEASINEGKEHPFESLTSVFLANCLGEDIPEDAAFRESIYSFIVTASMYILNYLITKTSEIEIKE